MHKNWELSSGPVGSLGLASRPVWAKYSLGHLQRRGGGGGRFHSPRLRPRCPRLGEHLGAGRGIPQQERQRRGGGGWALLRPRLPGSQETPELNPEAQELGWSGARRGGSNGPARFPPELPEVRQSLCVTALRWCVIVTHSLCVCLCVHTYLGVAPFRLLPWSLCPLGPTAGPQPSFLVSLDPQ